jgi:hypothetical protein
VSALAGNGPDTLLAALARSAPEIVVLRADREGRIVEVSAAARPSLALAAEGPEGGTLYGLLAEADVRTVEALLAGAPGLHGPRLLNLLDRAGSPFTVRAMIGVGEKEVVVAGVRAVEE